MSPWCWSGEGPAEPGFPGELSLDRIGVLGEQVVGGERRLAETAQEPVERLLRAHADGVGVGEVEHAVHGADPVGGEPGPVAGLGGLGQAEGAAQQRPVAGPCRVRGPERGDRRREPAGEVGEVLDQGAEVHLAAQGHRLELIRPVVAGKEPAGDGAQHGAAARASLDQELIGDEPPVRGLAAAVGEPASRVPGGHVELRRVLAEDGAEGAVRAVLYLAAPHEPGVDPRPGSDRGPDLVGGRGHLGFAAVLELAAHQVSSVSAAAAAAVSAAVSAVVWAVVWAVVSVAAWAAVSAAGAAGTLGCTALTRWC